MFEIPRRGKTWEGEERGTGVVILVYKPVGISIVRAQELCEGGGGRP